MFRNQAGRRPGSLAIVQGERRLNYGALLAAVDTIAAQLHHRGVRHGDRIGVLSENCVEYTQLQLAAARIGAIVACLNWRLADQELVHCVSLVQPRLLFYSERYAGVASVLAKLVPDQIRIADVASLFSRDVPLAPADVPITDDPESGLLLLFTSGTTGLPKAALISQRAELWRMAVLRVDLGIDSDDAYLAWSPMFHMGGTEHSLASLMIGSPVIITDGFDLDAIVRALTEFKLGWLLLVPATIQPLLTRMQALKPEVKGVKVVGCMADMIPVAEMVGITRALNARFFNSFGATETGLPPLSGDLIEPGLEPQQLGKHLSSFCEFRVVDAEGVDVDAGASGEGLVRGPTLFSGYWNAAAVDSEQFGDGWYRMGDLFRVNANGTYDFVGRAKYLIKSGGENIYPAEIERVLLQHPEIVEAVVVRKPDSKWGEIPVAFIATSRASMDVEEIKSLCRAHLAGYKQPKEVHVINHEEFPRSATGKIVREELETRIASGPIASATAEVGKATIEPKTGQTR
jgi:fatty-acyl-CoA synthase